jgi:DNA mismatch repair protein MSH2
MSPLCSARRFASLLTDPSPQVVNHALSVLKTFVEVLKFTFETVSSLDALQSMAYAASTNPVGYVKPTITDESNGVINIVAGRHPCVEHTAECYIPNDYELGQNTRFNIITGPNMGGKSTYIRGLGSIVAMAQIGR